jgi:hypothetical protein
MVKPTLRAMLRVSFGLAVLLCCEGARAQNVMGSTTANVQWAAASGPVAGYGVFISRNGTPFSASPTFTTTATSAPISGAYGDTLTIKVAAFNAAGTYGPYSPNSAPITFVPVPSIALSTTGLNASTQVGSTPGATSFTVRNSGSGILNYSITSNQSWVSVSPASGYNTGVAASIAVSFATSQLAVGTYSAKLTVSGGSGVTSQTIAVSLSVSSTGGGPAPAPAPTAAGFGVFSAKTGQWIFVGASSGLESSFSFGGVGFIPVYGDWNGDGIATIGAFDPATATWYLRNEPGPGNPDLVFQFGSAGAIPVVGDWDGNGTTTVGVYVPATAQWYLRNSNSAGMPDLSFQYGFPGAIPVVGDWNGNRVDTVGVYNPLTGEWLLRNSPGGGNPDLDFSFGYPGTQPVVGDWSGSGRDGIGIFDPTTGTWYLRDTPSTGMPDHVVSSPSAMGAVSVSVPGSSPDLPTPVSTSSLVGAQVGLFDQVTAEWTLQYGHASNSPFSTFVYGGANFVPVYGDWNGDGVATPGVFDPATATWYLRNEAGPGNADIVFQFGSVGAIPVVGDWDGNGTTTVGVYVPETAQWYLRNSNSAGMPDLSFQYGFPGAVPVVGNWNGGTIDTVGVYYPMTGQWLLRNSPGAGNPDRVFSFGYPGTQPLVGDWSNRGQAGIGLYDPLSGLFLLRNAASAGNPDGITSMGGGMTGGNAFVWKP